MKRIILLASLIIVAAACGRMGGETMLPRAIDPSLTEDFDGIFNEVRSFSTDELHCLMVVKDGKVVYERYEPGHEPEVRHIMWSASKTFTATAVGFAVQDLLINLDNTIMQYFTPDEIPEEYDAWRESITIQDLLMMSSGFDPIHAGIPEAGKDYNWASTELNRPMAFEPGTRWCYDSFDSYLLSVIVSRMCGEHMDSYLDKKLFRPLGIKDWYWEASPQGYPAGGWGLYLKPESFAKMGQFMLQKGSWNGKQLLDPAWIEEATAPHIMQYAGTDPTPEQLAAYALDDKNTGYGYQVWCLPGGGYRLDGAHGQYCYVIPEKNLVVACFASSSKTKIIRNAITTRIINRAW